MGGAWGIVLTLGNFAGGIIVDKVGRVRQIGKYFSSPTWLLFTLLTTYQ